MAPARLLYQSLPQTDQSGSKGSPSLYRIARCRLVITARGLPPRYRNAL